MSLKKSSSLEGKEDSRPIGKGTRSRQLKLLNILFDNIPAYNGMSFIIVQHAGPGHTSKFPQLLALHTRMKVRDVREGLSVNPNYIYVIPPNKDLKVISNKLTLINPEEERSLHELTVYEIELKIQNEELLATQESLTAAIKEYSELFEISPTGYFLLDKDGVIERVNERGCEQMGLHSDLIVGKAFSSFLHGPAHQENFIKYLAQVIESGKLNRIECEIRKSMDSAFFAQVKSILVRNERNEFKHFLCIVSDISQWKEQQRQTALSLVKAQQLNEMKSRFIGMASHEFRTPLSAILSSLSLAEQYAALGQPEKMQKHMERIRSSVKDLTSILDDFLSLEKLESGKVEVTRKLFDLPEFCENVIQDFEAILKTGQQIIYQHKGITKIVEDTKIVQHILLNLLSNACKYSQEGKKIYLVTEVNNDSVLIEVKDSGIGIPDQEQEHIFTRFYRAKNAATIQGTGLGLNIVKRYVDLINGKIRFISKEGEGTTFTVELILNYSI